MLEILGVEPDSIGAELELAVGDKLLSVNGLPVRDLLDFQIYTVAEELLLEVRKISGEVWEIELEKDLEDGLGLEFEHPEPNHCGNNCLFCFVHQLPAGLRPSLYVKDEDYRFSYLYGAYVTLTNITEAEICRILEQRLSPLYISVHATDEQLRTRLLGRGGPPILQLLARLAAGGISLHTQIVVCPGLNDGAALDQTIADLAGLGEAVSSLAVVPVGLTGHRQRLPLLRPHSREEARAVLDQIHLWQNEFLQKRGQRLVFAADEFYLQAAAEFPPLAAYEDLLQLENGVGLIPWFRQEAELALAEAEPLDLPAVSILTGTSFFPELCQFADRLGAKTGTSLIVHEVQNEFFGGQVSVAGLLTGGDIIKQLRGRSLGSLLLIPEVVLREGSELLLDDMAPAEVAAELGVPVKIIAATPWGLLEALEEVSV